MQLCVLRPRHRIHLRRGVELHRAGAERDHARGEREVARFQPSDVAQHLRLAMVAVKSWMREEVRDAREWSAELRFGAGRMNEVADLEIGAPAQGEDLH